MINEMTVVMMTDLGGEVGDGGEGRVHEAPLAEVHALR
jgi:hypothetical protein